MSSLKLIAICNQLKRWSYTINWHLLLSLTNVDNNILITKVSFWVLNKKCLKPSVLTRLVREINSYFLCLVSVWYGTVLGHVNRYLINSNYAMICVKCNGCDHFSWDQCMWEDTIEILFHQDSMIHLFINHYT